MTLAKLISKLAGFVGARFLGAAIGFLSQIALARLLPQADVGIVLMGMSAAAFVSLATHGGYALLAFTHLPKLAFHGRKTLTDAFHRTVLTDTILWSVLIFAGLFAASWLFNFTESQNTAWLFGSLCSPVASLMRYNSIIASSDRRIALSYIPDFLVRPSLFLGALLLLAASGAHTTPVIILTIFVVVTYAVTIGQALILGEKRLNLSHLGWPRRGLAQRIRFKASALMIVSAVTLAFADIVTLTAAFLLPKEQVAIVGITMRLAAIAGFILQAGQSFVMPDFSDAILRRDQKQADAMLLKLNLTTLVIIAGGLVGALALGHFVLRLFGDAYGTGWWLLILFIIGQSIRALGGMNQNILSMEGQQLRATGACVAALCIFFVFSYALIQGFGAEGIGYAVIIAEVFWLVALALMAQQEAGRRGDLLWLLMRRK